MKFKTFSKSAVLLTASLAVLAACGSKNTASSPDYKLEGVTFPLQETKTLKFMTASSPLAPKDPNEKLILQRLEKETGVHIEWTNYQSDNQILQKRETWIFLVVICQTLSTMTVLQMWT